MVILLKIKSKSGQFTLDALTATSSIKDLKDTLSSMTKIDLNNLYILHGYPPRPITALNDSTIITAGIKSGDTLLIEELKQSIKNSTNSSSTNSSFQECNVSNSMVFELKRHPVPANNSCLFTSIDFILNGGTSVNLNCAPTMRKIIAKAVASNPSFYTEAFLGKPNVDYQKWICDNQHWGGAIEISILSKHHSIEIAVIDIETGNLYRYGEDANYSARIFLIYDGIHYDPIIGLPKIENISKKHLMTDAVQTIFLSSDDVSIIAALNMAHDEQKTRKYTNITTASYKCLVCGIKLNGSSDMQNHSMETKHSNFAQI